MPRAEKLFGWGFMLVGTCLAFFLGGKFGAIVAVIGLGIGLALLVMAHSASAENRYPIPTIGSFLKEVAKSEPPALPKTPRPIARLKAEAAVIEVTNDGDGAYFSVPIEIHGIIRGKGKDVFAKWAHTGEVRAWIAKGQTCRLEIARIKWSAGGLYTCTWIILTVAPGNVVQEVESLCSSCPVSVPIIRADDITVSGLVVAEPDLQNGIQRFHIVLRAFDAISVIQKSPNIA